MTSTGPAAPTKKVRLPRRKKRLAWRRGEPTTIRKADYINEQPTGSKGAR